MCSAEVQPVLHQKASSQGLLPASRFRGMGHCLSCLTASALWLELHCWDTKMIEMLIASRRMSAAALACLKEKPQGIYLKVDQGPLHAGVKAEQLHWFWLSSCFFPLEGCELRICSLHQQSLTWRNSLSKMGSQPWNKLLIQVRKQWQTSESLLLCLCSGRRQNPSTSLAGGKRGSP